jgi:hypothetical protein
MDFDHSPKSWMSARKRMIRQESSEFTELDVMAAFTILV